MTSELFSGSALSVNDELPQLVSASVIGSSFGILRSILKAKNKYFGNYFLSCADDFLLVLSAYAALYICALNFNNGRIGVYEYIALFGTYFIYRATLDKPLSYVSEKLFGAVRTVLVFLVSLAARPIRAVYRHMKKTSRKIRAILCTQRKTAQYKARKRKMTKLASCGFGLFEK